jgi:hypothetical protein
VDLCNKMTHEVESQNKSDVWGICYNFGKPNIRVLYASNENHIYCAHDHQGTYQLFPVILNSM